MKRLGTHGRAFCVRHVRPALEIRRRVRPWHEERLDHKMIVDVALRLCVRERCSTTSRGVRSGDIGLRVRKKRSQATRRMGVRTTSHCLPGAPDKSDGSGVWP
jgi:hypothetical protein